LFRDFFSSRGDTFGLFSPFNQPGALLPLKAKFSSIDLSGQGLPSVAHCILQGLPSVAKLPKFFTKFKQFRSLNANIFESEILEFGEKKVCENNFK
jgi:hypothetical protein